MKAVIGSSNRPVLMMSPMMIGLDVAPVAPKARLAATSLGSTESSHSLVPQATRDCSGVRSGMVRSCGKGAGRRPYYRKWKETESLVVTTEASAPDDAPRQTGSPAPRT